MSLHNKQLERRTFEAAPRITCSLGVRNSPRFAHRQVAFTTLAIAGFMLTTAGLQAQQPTIQGPITITAGGTYSGTLVNNNPNVPAVSINTNEPVIIVNSTVTSKGPLFAINGTGSGANVTIMNTTGLALDPGIAGKQRGVFVTANDVSKLVVQNTSMSGVSFGVKVLSSDVSSLKILNNLAANLEDRESDGKGGLLPGRPDLGHFVILNAVTAPQGAEIGWNKLVNVVGASSTEDVINIYKSQGTQAYPITAHDNYMEGFSSTTTSSYSGSGVISDGDGSSPFSAFLLFENNDIVHTAGSGVEIASGHDVTARGNRVVSCGRNSNGSWFAMPFANAVSLWNYYGSASFYNNLIEQTAGGLVRPSGSNQPMTADSWANTPDLSNNNSIAAESFTDPCFVNGQLNLEAEDTERTYWSNKVAAAKVSIGDQHETLVQ